MACVLLVDDEPLVRRLVSRWLGHRGFEVECASNGRDALQLAHDEAFDAILSDVRMPMMTGVEFLRRLRAEIPHLPVVLMSGSYEIGSRDEALALGAFDFLRKPLDFEELEQVIRRAIEHGWALLPADGHRASTCSDLRPKDGDLPEPLALR